jgi:DNA topoisomerase-1
MASQLVIVESPTKAKTIGRFLGRGFTVTSSMGHIRDLPKHELGVDVDHQFVPRYVIPRKNQKTVTALKKAAAKADNVYFATDEDREGEAISWHLAEVLKADPAKVKRITFHEITERAIKDALAHPRTIDQRLVNAQQARRILDRLVGYELSPFLWKKVAKGLSAGRVQSVAVRLIVEREREIQAFKPEEYWSIEALFSTDKKVQFEAHLLKIDGKSLDKFALKTTAEAEKIVTETKATTFAVGDVERKSVQKNPLPPFTTSTLQQEANRKLGFSARKTMFVAQGLYEGVELGAEGSVGLITYMRTDSVNLAEQFQTETQAYLGSTFGPSYATGPRAYKTKSKSAQEAHEAIRPTGVERAPDAVRAFLTPDQVKIYDLIWRRAVASQMPAAQFDAVTVDVNSADAKYTFRANGSTVSFDGFLKIYPEALNETTLPELETGQALTADSITPNQHFTQPPARYSEAGLVKALEEYGIGRPSTYAPTIATIIDRNYVEKEDRRLKPTELAMLVNDVLVEHFPTIVDYQFTAKMEDNLDAIALGEKDWGPIIATFYEPFKANLEVKMEEVSKKELTETATDQICEKCGKPMVIKLGRYGKFLACTGYPECKNTRPLNEDGTVSTKPEAETSDQVCEKCGKPMVVKYGRYGKFLACTGYPECKNVKNIEDKIGVPCPQCNEGELVVRRSRFGKSFYSCNRYPDCKFALWAKPTGEKCPDCGSLLVHAKGGAMRCSSKTCKFQRAEENAPSES